MSEAIDRARWKGATDAELGEALVAGDSTANAAAFVRFFPVVYGIARRIIGPFGEVEDAVQEVFVRFFGSVRRLRAPDALRAYVITLASRTLSHERRRRRKKMREAPDGESMDARAGAVDVNAETKNAWLRLERLLDRLQPRERRTFLLHHVEGMNAAEIALALGVSVPTVRRSLAHARERIDTWAQRDAFLAEYQMLRPALDEEAAQLETEDSIRPSFLITFDREIAPPDGSLAASVC
jgi:RNA polymerase sigma-70 factor (ECF subfamily)